MLITVRKFDPATDTGIIEYRSGSTSIQIRDSRITSDLDKDSFIESFLPDGLWLAVDEGSVVGAILVATEDRNDSETVMVHGIRVDRRYRRQGLGGLLMHKADLYADVKKIERLTGIVPETNEPALSLFKKCRFIVSETGNGRIFMKKTRKPYERRP